MPTYLLHFQHSLWKRELEIMLTGMESRCKRDTPLLVVCCTNGPVTTRNSESLTDLSQNLGLDAITRPWAIFHVDISNMSGLEKSLDWLLYRIQKQRAELEYHSYQGKSF